MLRIVMLLGTGMATACAGPTTSTDEPEGCDADETTTSSDGCTSIGTADTASDLRELGGYTLGFLQFGVDAAGDIVPFEFASSDGDVQSDPRFFVVWTDDDSAVICVSEYDVAASILTGGPFDLIARANGDTPEAQGQTWNAWEWSLSFVEDDCSELLDKKDQAFIADFVPDTLYAGVGPAIGALGELETTGPDGTRPEFAGILGLWSAADDDAASPLEGGAFFDQRAFAALAWDGSSVLGTDAEGKDLTLLLPGTSSLQNAVIIERGGWEFGLD